MELKTNSQLDLTLNKEDLIDILIDQHLTKLENEKKELQKKIELKYNFFYSVTLESKYTFDNFN